MSFKNYEGSGFNLNLNMLTNSYEMCISYPWRSGLIGEKVTIEDPSPEFISSSYVLLVISKLHFNTPHKHIPSAYIYWPLIGYTIIVICQYQVSLRA